jgi:histidyl-tRNA synthetase
MSTPLQAPKGVAEYVPPRADDFLAVREALTAPARAAGYAYAETPVFETTELFTRGVGESTDIVSKEMFTFEDRGGRSLTLRPEGTAGVLRAALEHGLHRGQLPVKLWYAGAYFRAEAPQAGRYRQFFQVGIEAIGGEDPMIDAEVVTLAWDAYAALGLRDLRLDLNSLGCAECRPAYREALQAFLRGLDLDAETQRRIEINPLRVLDDKRPEVQAKVFGAPLLVDHLCADCKAHHDAVRLLLGDAGVTWTDAPRLVRGLDYYTRHHVRVRPRRPRRAVRDRRRRPLRRAVRDDRRAAAAGIGFGLGVDRTLLALEAEGVRVAVPRRVSVYGVPLGETAQRELYRVIVALRRRRDRRRPRLRRQGAEGRDEGRRPLGRGVRRRSGRARPGVGARPGQGPDDRRADRRTDRRRRPNTRGETAVIRTHQAGALRREHDGTAVVLTGWVANRRDHGGVVFIDLRDGAGVVQVVFREGEVADAAHELRAEYCVKVTGSVGVRPEGNANPDLPTGEVEVTADGVEVLSVAAPLPFQIDTRQDVDEQTRLRYRYLDLRRGEPARALRQRAHTTRVIRQVMDEHGFLDIETPYLTRSTPEGARDFLVPCRLQPGTWYALPQSPQLFKQLLMVAGFERYYQIARCFRDEDLRSDRQPEFTQLDVELSFPDEEDIYALTEELLGRVWRTSSASRSRRRSRG